MKEKDAQRFKLVDHLGNPIKMYVSKHFYEVLHKFLSNAIMEDAYNKIYIREKEIYIDYKEEKTTHQIIAE